MKERNEYTINQEKIRTQQDVLKLYFFLFCQILKRVSKIVREDSNQLNRILLNTIDLRKVPN